MSIRIDHQLREQITRPAAMFPVTFFCDELASIPGRTGPLHWHTDFEIATAERGVLDFQVGQQHVSLDPGDSIFINGNTLHGIKQLSGELPDPMPNIVFSGEVIAPESDEIYRKYIQPIAQCEMLPFVLFRQKDGRLGEVNGLIQDVYRLMRERGPCYEMAVQRDLSRIFEFIFLNLDNLPRSEDTRIQLESQVRIQKMLSFIREHYAEDVALDEIARAANVSRSEAGRCFHTFMGCSPVEALIQHRLQIARRLMRDTTLTLQEISCSCGFHSVHYFIRRFRQTYGYTPGQYRLMGK